MENTRMQQYEEVQAMVQKEIRTMFPDLFKEYATQFGVNKTPTHMHNGSDSVRIEQVNLINNIKYNFAINAQEGGSSETFSMRAIPNMSKLTLFGFAANNLSSPATERALINGHAAFGRCFEFNDPGAFVTPAISLIGKPITQGCNSVFLDSTSGANTRVSFSTDNIVRVIDETSTEVALMTIDSYLNNVITLTATLEANWQMFFSVIMS